MRHHQSCDRNDDGSAHAPQPRASKLIFSLPAGCTRTAVVSAAARAAALCEPAYALLLLPLLIAALAPPPPPPPNARAASADTGVPVA